MKTHIIILIVLLLVVAFPAALYAQETDPVAVVMARAEAFNAGDVAAAAAFFAEDAIYTFAEPPPNAQEVYNGREEIRGRLADLTNLNATMSLEVTKVEGNNVTTLTRYTDDILMNMGVDFIEGVEEYTVEDGLITFYRMTETEESKAKIAAVMAAQQTDPAAVVLARWEAVNAGDAEAGAALFADDATYEITDPATDFNLSLTGQDEILQRLQDIAAMHGGGEIEITEVDGDRVVGFSKYWDDGLRAEGVDYLEGLEEYVVQDGKIVFFKYATQGAVMLPPETLPESGGNPGPTAVVVLLVGAMLILAGLLAWSRAATRG